jgi:hypothetical protein
MNQSHMIASGSLRQFLQIFDAGSEGDLDCANVEVEKLLAAGKCKQAVELAKELHKKAQTDQSQRLLVHAYVARIQQFQSKGMGQEAQTLIALVQQRFPSERHQLASLELRALADAGKIDELLRPLTSDQTSPETRAYIESILAGNITDLPAVASCCSLPVDHSLRKGAAAIWRAFTAVVSGPVTDEEISLPEISRRSPFAAWKLLIRAIAAFYNSDDEGCRRALDLIPVDSAVAHLAKAVRALVERNKPTAGIASVLYTRVLVDDEPLRAALNKIETAFRFTDIGMLLAGIRESVRLCASTRPQLLERLRQHISIACMLNDVPVDSVISALGSTTKNSYFWHLSAQAQETIAPGAISALHWERFICHAVAEKMFSPSSLEVAIVWLHIADLLSPASLETLRKVGDRIGQSRYISSYYADQPPEVARLQPGSDRELADFVLAPGRGFEQAAMIRADTQTFTRWMAWAERWGLPVKQQEVIASAWHKAQPRDVQPLLILSSLAEERKALTAAIKHVADAEAVDPMNQQVRRARVRLTLSITWRHFADGKSHLVEKDLAELAALPGMNEGDRAGVLESIRGAWHQMRGDLTAENNSFQAVADRIGFLAATVVFDSIKKMAKLAGKNESAVFPADVQPLEVALAQATALRLADDLKLKIYLPVVWTSIVRQVLRQRPCPLSHSDLLMLGRGGLLLSEMETAYLASSAGLVRSNPPAIMARLLLLRANCLNQYWQRPRATQCLRAALELARQAHDQDLIRDIFAVVDRDEIIQLSITDSRDGKGLADDALRQILESEAKADAYPNNRSDVESFVVKAAIPQPVRRFAEFEDEDSDWDDDEEDGLFGPGILEFDADEDDEGKNQLPNLNRHQLNELMNAAGMSNPLEMLDDPTSLIAAMAEVMGKKISQAEMKVLVQELSRAVASGYTSQGSGANPKQQKRNKRR